MISSVSTNRMLVVCRGRCSVCSGPCSASSALTASRSSTRRVRPVAGPAAGLEVDSGVTASSTRQKTETMCTRAVFRAVVTRRRWWKELECFSLHSTMSLCQLQEEAPGLGTSLPWNGPVWLPCYHVAIIIVLINMLIAMMSHSFEDIQVS